MGLQFDIQSSVGLAFDTSLSDAVNVLSIERINTVFDPATNTTVKTTEVYETRGVLAGYSNEELVDTNIQPTDLKAIILQNDVGIEPKLKDYMINGSERYEVVRVSKDPADCIWKIQCRK